MYIAWLLILLMLSDKSKETWTKSQDHRIAIFLVVVLELTCLKGHYFQSSYFPHVSANVLNNLFFSSLWQASGGQYHVLVQLPILTLKLPSLLTLQVKAASLPTGTDTFSMGLVNSGRDPAKKNPKKNQASQMS